MRIRAVPIRERAVFEQLVLQQLDSLEEPIEILEEGLETQWGNLTLGLDSSRTLVMVLISSVPQDDLISRILAIQGWLSNSRPLINRFYGKKGIDSAKGIRAIALAPGFSAAVIDGRDSLAFGIEFYRCRGIEVNGEQGVLIEPYPEISSSKPSSSLPKVGAGRSNLTEAEVRFFEQTEPLGPPA